MYSFDSFNPSEGEDYFNINSTTGAISLSVPAVDIPAGTYAIIVQCNDSNTFVSYNVEIITENIFSPTFSHDTTFYETVSESLDGDTVIVDFNATDGDAGTYGEITYLILSGNTNNAFEIDSSNGQLTAATPSVLNYADVSSYTLVIHASNPIDPNANISQVAVANLYINITAAPVFNQSSHSIDIPETDSSEFELPKTGFITVICTDVDTPSANITYSLQGVSSDIFTINNQGQLSVERELDYDNDDISFQFMAVCRDGSGGYDTTTISITVLPVNEHTPTIKVTPIPVFGFLLGYESDMTVGRILVSQVPNEGDFLAEVEDKDSGQDGIVTFELKSEHEIVSIDPDTGTIEIANHPDADDTGSLFFGFSFKACDQDSCETSNNIQILVLDTADEEPMFEEPSYQISIPEGTSPPSIVVNATCTDRDFDEGKFEGISFINASSEVTSLLALDDNTGTVSLKKTLDYEEIQFVEFRLLCEDTTGLQDFTNVSLSIVAVNDEVPYFGEKGFYFFNVSRTTPADMFLIGTVDAYDDDIGTGGSLTYYIEANPYFAINQLGNVLLEETVENVTEFFLNYNVTVSDGDNQASIEVIFQLTDGNYEAPVFTTDFVIETVSELLPVGTSILTIHCEDSESGRNGEISYYINDGNFDNVFTMNSDTGVLSVASPLILPHNQSDATYVLTFQCTDKGIPSMSDYGGSIVRVVQVDLYPPDIMNDTIVGFISENAKLNTIVVNISAIDYDTDTLMFSLQDESVPGVFTIAPTTGEVRLNTALDREMVSIYNMTAVATEILVDNLFSEPKNDTAELFIYVRDVNDNSPECGFLAKTIEISNTVSVGDTILALDCSDADFSSNANLTYTLDNNYNIFQLDKSTLVLIDHLNQTNQSTLSFTITVADQGTPPMSIDLSIIVNILMNNNFIPVFTNLPEILNVSESTPVFQSPLFKVNAEDEDRGDFGNVRYKLLDQDSLPFILVPNTGDLYLSAKLDFHDTSVYYLNVTAFDPQYSVYETLTVNVLDANEYSPTCTSTLYTSSITEGIPLESVESISLGCNDADSGPNGDLTYSITAGNVNNDFSVSTVGVVSPNVVLDYESVKQYNLEIEVSDGGSPPNTLAVTVHITVNPVNEYDPVIANSSYILAIDEDQEIGSNVLTVSATDNDDGDDGSLDYELVPSQSKFGITSKGVLLVTGTLDRETQDLYNFTVVVTDGGSQPRSSMATVNITLNDVDDSLPQFTQSLYINTSSIDDVDQRAVVAVVECTDADLGDNGEVTYSITPSDITDHFTISDNGVIKISNSVPLSGIYSFGVVCTSVANSNYTDSAQVSITLSTSNNVTFGKSSYTADLAEDAGVGTVFLTINATSVTNTMVSYELVDPPSMFQIEASSGDLMLVGQLDFETTESYILIVEGSDEGSPPNTAQVAVYVNIVNINDGTPQFTTSPDAISITEEVGDYELFGPYVCSDSDIGSYGEVSYSIGSGNTGDAFSIDQTSGYLQLVNAVDYETVKAFSLELQCDDGTFTDTLTLPVTVTAVNEYPPEFASETVELTVAESVPVATILTVSNELEAQDMDDDPHNQIWYSIIAGNDDNKFAISSTEGVVTLIQLLDYEVTTSYTLTVMADDSGGLDDLNYQVMNSTVSVLITVTDSNDNTPMFAESIYAGSIPESALVGDYVEMDQIQCSDADSGQNGETELTIVEGNTGEAFLMLENGNLEVNKELNYENTSTYYLTVQCIDGGSPAKFDEITVVVYVTDTSEFGPIFEVNHYSFTINENVSPGFLVGEVKAIDQDTGSAGTVTYSISSDEDNLPFYIESNNGEIRVKDKLDYETHSTPYIINVTAYDHANQTDEAVVTITLSNINEHNPSFEYSNYYGEIRENSNVATSVDITTGVITCTDIDDIAEGLSPTFSLDQPNDLPFAINPTTGALTSIGDLDLETEDRYTFKVVCTDNGGFNTTADVTVDLTPFNDFAPEFLNTPYSTSIVEGQSLHTTVFTVSAFDADEVDYNEITFGITEGNDDSRFAITTSHNSSQGIVTTIADIDYEKASSYVLTISAYNVIPNSDDSGSTPMTAYTELTIDIIDINDNKPVITIAKSTVLITDEDNPGTTVTTVTCTDADSGNYGNTTLYLTGPNKDKFELLDNGTIITSVLIENDLFLEINCTDMGDPQLYSVGTINIDTSSENDYFPDFPSDVVHFEIYENATVGESIGCVNATDADGTHTPSGILTYSLTLKVGEDHFTVDADTGCIIVAVALDYDDIDYYSYSIRAADGGIPSKHDDATITIDILNVEFDPPEFKQGVLTLAMSEGTAANTTVTTKAVCTDRDDGDIITYTIEDGANNDTFTIDSATGVITLSSKLDYEVSISHTLTVRCTDSSNLYDEAQVIISVTPVNEFTPIFISKLVYPNEQSPVGTEITILEYSDGDAGVDGMVTFEIITPEYLEVFLISETDDIVTLRFNEVLDRETQDFYPVQIQVTDLAELPRSSTGFINITLSDINDNKPIPGKEIYTAAPVNVTAPVGYLVETVNCSDADINENAQIEYSIEDNAFFAINEITGEITVLGDLSDREKHTISVDVYCSDQGDPVLSSSFPLQVPIIDPNVYPPQFLESSYSVTLAEDAAISEPFINVTATDGDSGLNGKIQYSLLDDFDNQFFINATSGEISLLVPLDFEAQASYVLTVEAIDGASDSPDRKTDTVNVSVIVTGVNEHTPECLQPVYTAYIYGDTVGTVLSLACSDSDDGEDGLLSYSIVPGTHSSLFNISDTGNVGIPSPITPNASIEVYEITVLVADQGSPSKSTDVEVDLIYSFVNAESPQFNQTQYTFKISESTSVGKVVHTVLATDSDPGIQGDITYSINGTDYFRVKPSNGELFVASTLDWETLPFVVFSAVATDGDPMEPLSGTALVNVTILDENDNSPQCTLAFYTVTIGSGLGVGKTVLDLQDLCSDADGPSNSLLSYTVSPDSTFIISPVGTITLNGTLTPDTSTALTVTVSDNGMPSMTTTITIIIVVTFDNLAGPVFTNTNYNFNISEGATILSEIGTIQATDSDSPSSDLHYSLVSTEYSQYFYIDPVFGDIILTSSLDYEQIQEYTITVSVRDSGGYNGTNVLSNEALVTITVINANDNLPVLSNGGIYGATISKTTPINTTVLSIQCSDNDLPDYGSPDITEHDFNTNVPFSLTGSDGSYSVIVSDTLTDLEGSRSYTLNVTCSDNGGLTTSGQVFLFVPDTDAPVFNASQYQWEVREDAETGTVFSELSAMSQDGSEVSYAIVDGNDGGLFYINPDTGVVSLSGALDYETQASHGLVVKATDGQSKESSVLLLVLVVDVDDVPTLMSPSTTLQVEQHRQPGYPVGQLQCLDEDSPSIAVNITFELITDVPSFTVDSTGIVRVNQDLDDTTVYVLPVSCYDAANPNVVSTGIVTVEIIFENLYSPVFDLSTYIVSIYEDAETQSVVTTVQATDDDIGSRSEVTYSIINGNPNQFYIDATLGDIQLLTSLDRESVDVYNLTVQAVDGGIGANDTVRRTATATVTIHVLDVNDNTPSLDKLAYIASIYTNHTLLSSVLQVNCTDPDLDENGIVSLGLDPTQDSFIIDDGGIKLSAEQSDQAVYNFYVTCQDMGSEPLSASSLVTIVISKVEFAAPVFNQDSYSIEVPEDQALLDPFLTVNATVNDSDVSIVYSIIAGNNDSKFFINSQNGELSVVDNLDYNKQSVYTLTVQAETTGFVTYSSQATVAVTVTDVNNNDPVFSPLSYYTAYVEELVEVLTPVVQLNCSDLDPTSTLTYSITDSTPAAGLDVFGITSSGLVNVETSPDYETSMLYILTVQCSDGGSSPTYATVRIDIRPVNEYTPMFLEAKYEFSVDENIEVGMLLGYVNATDDDAGIDGQITYLLQDPGNLSAIFVHPSSGSIRVSDTLDYEDTPFYNLSVIARDKGGKESYTSIELTVVNIQDTPPVLTPEASVHEGKVLTTDPEGLFIELYTCQDEDGGSTTISITGGNDMNYFTLNSLNQLLWNASPSLSADVVVSLVLQCIDEGNQTDTSTIAIVVGPPGTTQPQFNQSAYEGSVTEDAPIGYIVLSVSAAGGNISNPIEYGLFSLPGSFPFTINSTTGEIAVSDALDYEDTSSYSFSVQAEDLVESSIVIALVSISVVDINDNSPTVLPESLTLSLAEDASQDIAYGKFTCTDQDDGVNGETSFTLSSGTPFTVTDAGYVFLSGPLDYETSTEYNITVTCNDGGSPSLADTAILLVMVSGVNEHAPQFLKDSYNFTVSEFALLGHSIGHVNATDSDHGTNGQFIFEIQGGTGVNDFQIGYDTGVITVKNNLNASDDSELTLVLAATDNGPPAALTTTVLANVVVTDVNEEPEFDSLAYSVTIATDTAMPEDTLVEITCTDYDLNDNGRVSMSIVTYNDLTDNVTLTGGTPSDGSVSGSLDLVTTLPAGSYEVIVQCIDSGSPALSANASVSILVQGVNTAPVFDSLVYGVSIHEDFDVGTSLLTVNATDKETDVSYYITGGTGLGTFSIEEDTGIIRISSSLDYETTSTYLMTVSAIDMDELNPQTGTTEVSITIVNVNDHAPVVLPGSFTTTLSEATYESESINVYTCTDADGGDTSFSINESPPFSINEDGQVTYTGEADYEVATSYTVTVTCTDMEIAGGDTQLSGTATLVVTIKPINFDPPVFTSPAAFNVSEGSSVTDVIVNITAYDPDMRGTISYDTDSHTDVFTLNSETGQLSLISLLDRETEDMYTLSIEASDNDDIQDNIPLETTATITIHVTDINDQSPSCTSTLESFIILEGDYNETQYLYTPECSDKDIGLNGQLTYSFKSGTLPTEGTFNLNETTGELTFIGSITKTGTGTTVITIIVSDLGVDPESNPAEIQIILTVLTGKEPYFKFNRYNATIPENLPLSSVVFNGSDFVNDLINTGDSEIQFKFLTNSTTFLIDESTGNVVLLSDNLDYDEGLQKYSLGIKAIVGSETADTILDIFITDYNDNAPHFTSQVYNGQVRENLPEGSTIATVSADDIDSGSNAEIIYYLSSDTSDFFINSTTGVIIATNTFDREAIQQYSLVVIAEDRGIPSQSSSANVIVEVTDENDVAPVFPQELYELVIYDTSPPAAVLYTFSAIDPDITGSIRYSLSTDDPFIDSFLNIDPLSGILRQVTSLPPTYPSVSLFQVLVNDQIATGSADVGLQIVTVSEVDLSFIENEANQQQDLYQSLSLNFDVTSETEYFIIDGDDYNQFEIQDSNLVNTVPLDRENKSSYTLHINAVDNTTDINIIIEVNIDVADKNDNPPVFKQDVYVFNVTEGHYPTNTLIGSVTATDNDQENTLNSRISYEVVFGPAASELSYTLDILTGNITLIGNIDRESSQFYFVKVRASDSGSPEPLFSYTDVYINLIDINDNKPYFIPNDVEFFVVYYLENAPVGRFPMAIKAVRPFGNPMDISAFEFVDRDSSSVVTANLSGAINMTLTSQYSPAQLVSTGIITIDLNDTDFDIIISDGDSEFDEIVPVRVIVQEKIVTSSLPTRPTSTTSFTFRRPTPTIGGVDDFIETPLGIAAVVVGAVAAFALFFLFICLCCFCYQRYKREKDNKKRYAKHVMVLKLCVCCFIFRRLTSIFRRLEAPPTRSKSYQYNEIDQLDYPYLTPCK